jgi:hypothetical protein
MTYTPEQIAEIVIKVLNDAITNQNLSLKVELAQHPRIPVEILQTLAQDKDYDVREEAIKNPNYKSKTLELTSAQYEALKTLLASSQDEILKSVTL